MHAARGILPARGGMTSHAAVVARGMGRPCVSGASALSIDMASRTLKIQVGLGGQVRLCDAGKTLSDSTPDGCDNS